MKKYINKFKTDTSYFLMNTTAPIPLFGKNRELAKLAQLKFNEITTGHSEQVVRGKKFIIHEFGEGDKKALVCHGWMSSSVHMVKQIHNLVDSGFKVYAIDFPGHGQSKGFKCSWKDAVEAILIAQRLKGKFDLVLGHSFGGGMLVNASALSHLTKEFKDFLEAKQYVLLASALSVNVPVRIFSRLTGLRKSAQAKLEEKIVIDANIDLEKMSARYLQTNFPTDSKFLLIHGTKDKVVKVEESRDFAKLGENVQLIELDDIGHLNIIYSDKIIDLINESI